jgi:hypothetical protein
MKKHLLSVATMTLLLGTVTQADTRVGMGLDIVNPAEYALRMPIDLQNNLRVEPKFGIQYNDNDNAKTTNFTIGTNIGLLNAVSKNVLINYGGFLEIGYANTDYDNNGINGIKDVSDTVFTFGGMFGFEYFLEKHVSIGGEARVGIGFGDATVFGTKASALLRYYF